MTSLDLLRTATISTSFFVLFWVSAWLLPGNNDQVGHFGYASFIFLPHGIRVIAAWLYGWRSILYLSPGAYLAHYIRVDTDVGLSWQALVMPVFGIICVALTFELFARLGSDFRLRDGFIAPWHTILWIGAVGSLGNALGSNLIVQNPMDVAAAYLIGDVTGMIVLFVIIMLIFRALRRGGY